MILLLGACTPPPKDKTDLSDVTLNIDQMLGNCKKAESDVTITAAANQNQFDIEDDIDTKAHETVDCEGKVIAKEKRPVRNLSKRIYISAPAEISKKVSYVQVENDRTCGIHAFDSDEGEVSSEQDEESTGIDVFPASKADQQGNVRLVVSDDTYTITNFSINTRDGKNPMKVTYFGECLKYDAKKEATDKSKYRFCIEPQILGSKEILVNIRINRPEVEGVVTVKECRK